MRNKCGQSGMKVLLLDRHTNLYYAGQDTWTAKPSEAFDFQFSAGLPEYCEKLALSHTQLVVHFGNTPSGLSSQTSLQPTSGLV